tara:strand:- start:1768 stop:2037 length:270 start_codon:yes stop_codon:yes gene_type:complete
MVIVALPHQEALYHPNLQVGTAAQVRLVISLTHSSSGAGGAMALEGALQRYVIETVHSLAVPTVQQVNAEVMDVFCLLVQTDRLQVAHA